MILSIAELYLTKKAKFYSSSSVFYCSLVMPSLSSSLDVLHELSPLRTAFVVLLKSIQTALTIAVSTAHCEHSLSALKHIKSNLRSTMTQQWLVDSFLQSGAVTTLSIKPRALQPPLHTESLWSAKTA